MQWAYNPTNTKLTTISALSNKQTWHKPDFVNIASRFPYCVLLALSWNTTTNENPSTDKLSRAINYMRIEAERAGDHHLSTSSS